jgi:transposase
MVHTMKSQAGDTARTRRQHDRAFKAELVEQSLRPGASVSAIALASGVNANLLFKWRRDHVRAHGSPLLEAAKLRPVCVIPPVNTTQTQPLPETAAVNRPSRPGVIELEIAGAQLRLRGGVDEAMLSSVLRALRQSA